MKIITYNVNGIRAAFKKGFVQWLATTPADVICLQEIKATADVVDVHLLDALGYTHHWFSAQKKGYSGVAILSRLPLTHVKTGTGHELSDFEGRVIQAECNGVTIINAYFPSGTSGDHRQDYKYVWLEEFAEYVQEVKKKKKKVVVCGDYNIAHQEIDIHDPKSNKNTTGFLPQERDWLTNFFEAGWVDAFRHMNKEPHHYTWWSQRFPSLRLNNKGWRIDYISVSTALKKLITHAEILPDIKHSDHCPVLIELNLP